MVTAGPFDDRPVSQVRQYGIRPDRCSPLQGDSGQTAVLWFADSTLSGFSIPEASIILPDPLHYDTKYYSNAISPTGNG